MSGILLYLYGSFLILCGIVSVALIGIKAKTALASGGISGLLAIGTGWFIIHESDTAKYVGIGLSSMLFIIFCWRSAKTLFKIFELIPTAHPDLNGKGIAFLIISLMAVVSVFVSMLQVLYLF
jgi:hypothetical protein